MKRRRFLAVTVGVLVLSVGLVLMTDSAEALPLIKGTPTKNWDANLPSGSRFTAVFAGAVRDDNTGLVWEQALDTTPKTWVDATIHCVRKNVGGTVGWRLPSVVELNSVRDPLLGSPFVPAGVFTDLLAAIYWSASAVTAVPGAAWFVDFRGGEIVAPGTWANTFHTWCVRGPMQESAY